MQRTAARVKARIGEDGEPFVLEGAAVEAVQRAAADEAQAALQEVVDTFAAHTGQLATLDLGDLLGLRDHLLAASTAVEVLVECRPLDELDSE